MGYKIEDIVHPEAREFASQFTCGVCLCILDEPSQTSCDHIFCESCVAPCLACPTCRTPLSEGGRKPLRECNKVVMRMMHNLKVRCPHHAIASAEGASSAAAAAGSGDGEGEGEDGEPAAKRARTAPAQCGWEGNYTDLLAKHLLECPFHEVPCPHGCGVTLRRMDLDDHYLACAKNFEMCPICNARVKNGEMSAHRVKKAELHVQILEAKIAEQEEAGDGLKGLAKTMEKVATTQHVSNTARQRTDEMKEFVRSEVKAQLQKHSLSQCSNLVWKAGEIGDLRRRLPKGTYLESPDFELRGIGPCCLRLFPNGGRRSKDGFGSVYFTAPPDVLLKVKIHVNSGWHWEFDRRDFSSSYGHFNVRLGPIPAADGDQVKVGVELIEVQCMTLS